MNGICHFKINELGSATPETKFDDFLTTWLWRLVEFLGKVVERKREEKFNEKLPTE